MYHYERIRSVVRDELVFFPQFVRDKINDYVDLHQREMVATLESLWLEKTLTELHLRKFDISKWNKSGSRNVIITASRNSGKSYLAKDLIRNIARTPIVMNAWPTLYDDVVDKKFQYDAYSPELINKIVARSRALHVKKGHIKKESERIMLISDETVLNTRRLPDEFRSLWLASRHYGVDCILIDQTGKYPPDIRGNVDYIFLGRNSGNIQQLYQQYGGVFPTRKLFETTLRACTDDVGGFMVITNYPHDSRAIRDNVFWYRSTILQSTNFDLD